MKMTSTINVKTNLVASLGGGGGIFLVFADDKRVS